MNDWRTGDALRRIKECVLSTEPSSNRRVKSASWLKSHCPLNWYKSEFNSVISLQHSQEHVMPLVAYFNDSPTGARTGHCGSNAYRHVKSQDTSFDWTSFLLHLNYLFDTIEGMLKINIVSFYQQRDFGGRFPGQISSDLSAIPLKSWFRCVHSMPLEASLRKHLEMRSDCTWLRNCPHYHQPSRDPQTCTS